jgi:hypothetical protein
MVEELRYFLCIRVGCKLKQKLNNNKSNAPPTILIRHMQNNEWLAWGRLQVE